MTHTPSYSGNFTDLNGNLVATVLPSADTGIISDESGTFFLDLVLPLRWAVDGKLAYLRSQGPGCVIPVILCQTRSYLY